MQPPSVPGEAWREAQNLVGCLARTRPLPQPKATQHSQELQLHRQLARRTERTARQARTTCKALDRQQPPRRIEPDVDEELWEVLELATEDELESIHGILYGEVQPQFLSFTSLVTMWPGTISYRQVKLSVCKTAIA